MQFLKEKIVFKPNVNQNIQITLSENVDFLGIQEDIDDFVAEETGLSINDVEDAETFRYLPDSSNDMKVYFISGGTYFNSYEAAGFTTGETALRDEVVLRSFYLFQIYDTTSTQNQTLLSSGYYNGFNFIKENDLSTIYTYDEDDEFSNIYLPNSFINTLSGVTTIYGKMSFYNAKSGELQLFSQPITDSYVEPTTDDNKYFEIELDAENFTYNVSNIYSFEISNADYVEKINKTIDSFDNEKPSYPTGGTFLNTGKYI